MFKANVKGMTLIEIVIALAIFSVAAIILLNGIIMTTTLERKSMYVTATGSDLNEDIDREIPVSGTSSDPKVTVNFGTGSSGFTAEVSGRYEWFSEADQSGIIRNRVIFIPNE